ncbi:hypothetical protein BHE74_00008736 [Ensete ventricosum]|nr:hypothetical protein GW17_00021251 [Ensete ventricosum]RWW82781.1 hypothetical protein BHE74_00008736 [Ensete ventricosum]RZS10060.1 hypothetical protein BHM03_00041214 [Ensete ventricosum]
MGRGRREGRRFLSRTPHKTFVVAQRRSTVWELADASVACTGTKGITTAVEDGGRRCGGHEPWRAQPHVLRKILSAPKGRHDTKRLSLFLRWAHEECDSCLLNRVVDWVAIVKLVAPGHDGLVMAATSVAMSSLKKTTTVRAEEEMEGGNVRTERGAQQQSNRERVRKAKAGVDEKKPYQAKGRALAPATTASVQNLLLPPTSSFDPM